MEMNEAKRKIAENALEGKMEFHDALEGIMPKDDHAARNDVFLQALGREALGAHYRRVAVKEDGYAEINNNKMWERIYAGLSKEEARKVLSHLIQQDLEKRNDKK